MPILSPNTLEFFSHSPEQTRRVGIRLGSLLKPGQLVCLEGDLGSGKTTLVQGIAQGWGSADPVSSPTYVIINDYRHPEGTHLYHTDAYRLSGTALDIAVLDLPGMLERGVVVLEWADLIRSHLPAERLWIQMQYMALEQRHLVFTPVGKAYASMCKELEKMIFGAS